ncbi:MAG: flagellar basal body-associated FliL family protein [Fimbriimonadales bacterium]|nr:flagellar basal body-associated FliL family protein [Fimbriimonadales bacterium]
MAEEAKAAGGKKGGGKLPILIVLALVLGAGGFFAMKMKGGGEKASEPELKLGKIEELDEFLVNLAGGGSYLRARIALHLAEGAKEEQIKGNLPAIRDAIILTLTNKTLREVESLDGKRRLKREIAAKVNGLLEGLSEEEKPSKKKRKKSADEEADAAQEEPENPDWDSDTGPVLKVYLTDFATQ